MTATAAGTTTAGPATEPRTRRRGASQRGETALVVFAFLLMTGPPRIQGRDLNAALDSPFALDPAGMIQVVTWVGAGVVVTYLLSRPRHRGLLRAMTRFGPSRWYLAFSGLAVVSALWSTSPIYTLFFAGKIVLGTLVVVLLATHGRRARFDRPIRILVAASVMKVVVMLALLPVRPSLVAGYTPGSPLGWRLTGGILLEDYGHSPLFLGMWLLATALFGPTRRSRRWALIAYFATWVVQLLAQARTHIIIAVLAFVIMCTLAPSARNKKAMIVLACVVVAVISLFGRFHSLIGVAARGGEGVSNLTGRTDAYSYLMPVWHQKPLFGWGYAAGTRTALLDFERESGLGIGSGHDILSTTLVDVGLLGAAMLGLVYLSTWRQILLLWQRTRRRRQERGTVVYLVCITVHVAFASIVGVGIEQHLPAFLALLGTMWAFGGQLAAHPPASPVRRPGPEPVAR